MYFINSSLSRNVRLNYLIQRFFYITFLMCIVCLDGCCIQSNLTLLCLQYIIGFMEVKGGSKAGLSQENGEVEEDVFNHDP